MNTKVVSGVLIVAQVAAVSSVNAENKDAKKKQPNVIFVFADQLRAQALGYAGDENVISPNIDKLASESVNLVNAVSGMPVSTPYRGIMLTGQFPQNNGMFMNDVQLNPETNSTGKIFKAAGYNTAYIGKWHINGHGRTQYIPEENRQGFDYFKALECTHDYLHSVYYDNNDTTLKYWEGYDAIDQTKDAIRYIIEKHDDEKPFVLYMSWGGPHNPYQTVSQEYKDMYAEKDIRLRDNVPDELAKKAKTELKGYYAQITALDDCIGMLQATIDELGIAENTIFVFTADHGDMLGSQGPGYKQRPYEESIMVPFLLRYDGAFGKEGVESRVMLNSPDILPTLLGLANIDIPSSIDGDDLSPVLLGKAKDKREGVLLECITPFGDFRRSAGGKEFRGIRTDRYTYVKDLEGPWLLFDNHEDPYQMNNLVNNPEYSKIQKRLEKETNKLLKARGDEFLRGEEYIKLWNYEVNSEGTVDYKKHDK
ncbi:MAG: sulfatase [Rikenellaceae bacterium]